MWYQYITIGGFPHSEISGSKSTYNSPKHIVVRHVLHQLLVPRHSPCALNNLTTICYHCDIHFYPIWWVKEQINCSIILITFIQCYPHTLSSFQRTISERFNLSKPSKTFIASFFFLHRKEVIHPHVPVGIPCYDFTPVTGPTLVGPLPCGLGYHFRVLPIPMAWRAVCTTPGNVFTVTFWFTITSDSNFMESSCRLQSELRLTLEISSISRYCDSLYQPL